MKSSQKLFARRQERTRNKIRKAAGSRPRLSVFRSSKHIYAQLVDDSKGVTLAAASSLEKDFKGGKGTDIASATAVGKLLAERATKAGVTDVIFDRGGYMYRGRVKALGDAAREAGLQF